ncbi:SGNH/GDSL hydrolase family protein [Microbacterium sp. IEGM 1404]|uniref:SGNH/GDSL hydrolase family protein n=1 Tax=Microbacterium sp. IEGM 1404 TaxID=3047084 RepID=UPI0024B77799|nr:SGNH/GDSL hydrolase family protein [Microbacterium sp. IEGM 1404]MDI9890120.1 SGNH/GDSL hydrolase family protein [Microbacterium sp. IEGM 1404]
MRRLFVSGAALVALALSAFLVAGNPAAAAVPDLTGRSYVALGDSYAAAWGLPLSSTQPAQGCDQSDQNYPHLLAAQFGFSLTDRSCGGAVIANVVDTPQAVAGGTAPAQSDSLDADTALVTLTIGGNDLGFWNIGQMCVALSAVGPVAGSIDGQTHATCREQFVVDTPAGPVNTLETQVDQTVAPALESAIATIQTRAPNAKIVVIGYPALAPDAAHTPSAGCYSGLFQGLGFRANAYPYTDVDVALLHDTQVYLDDAMSAATQAAGATYVSLLADSVAHSPCTPADSYVNGISLTLSPDSIPVSGLPFGGVKIGALHPNASGAVFAAGHAADVVRELFAEPDRTPTPTPTPTPTSTPTTEPTATPEPTASPTATSTPTPSASASAAAASPAGLASTGAPSVATAIGIGVAMLIVGAVVTIFLRRRRVRD